ncbi:hypothetical protein CTEN210_18292 [Chaetoceros tenuissimus]|uniref:JmjC domain-containing protein n=1 Tax=Chaetoceros tenuissimus TaxID=426638 RepID=A0AAD3HFW7_9STRA|nr:hypothetical protein CTEN210_18292 [Chaetoceros tenuissimus]
MSYSMFTITHVGNSNLDTVAIEKQIAEYISTSHSNVTVMKDEYSSAQNDALTIIVYPDEENDNDVPTSTEAIFDKLNNLISDESCEWATKDTTCTITTEEEEEVSIDENEALELWRNIPDEERTLHLNVLPNPDGELIQPRHNTDSELTEVISSPTESQLKRDPTLLEFDNVERVDIANIDQISWDKPIIITNVLSDELQNSILTRKQLMIDKYGDTTVRTGNRETLIENGFTNSMPMSLDDAWDIRNHGSMQNDCGTIVFSPVKELTSDFISELKPLCDCFPNESKSDPIEKKFTLTIASEGFGIGMHKHNPAMFMLLTGRKKWYMSNSEDLEGVIDTHPGFYRDLSSHKCIQQPGEVLYVPNEWYHEIFNLDYTVGIQALPDQ